LGGILDLDDLCPEIGELHGRPRAGAELLDRDDAHVGQGRGRLDKCHVANVRH
jgi:hypothetical protein